MRKESPTPAGLAGARWLRRPEGLVERTRWLFCLAALVSLALTVPASFPGNTAAGRALAVCAALVLAAACVARYRRRGPAGLLDGVEVAAVLTFASACFVPAAAYGFTFAALWFRALHGSSRQAFGYAVGMVAAMAGSLLGWGLVPGHAGTAPAAPVLGALPVLLVTVAVARYLALTLFAREQSQRRDTALARLGTELLGVTDRTQIYALAWRTTAEITLVTPGLRILVVAEQADGVLTVRGHTGEFRRPPTTLPSSVLPAARSGEPAALASSWALDEAVGSRCEWVCMGLPQQPEGTMILGTPGAVSVDATVALRSSMNQVALAIRTSDAHRDLEHQAHTDGLTGLANRTAFTAALQAARGPAALLFLDLDDFKTVNDGLGHAAGDELLRHVADRLRATLRPEDLCARLGGDEFAVLLADRTEEGAAAVAGRLVDVVSAPVTLGGRTTQVGLSVGVACAAAGFEAEQLVQRADAAMYAAKANGKNRAQVFHPVLLHTGAYALFDTELAAAASSGQLVVHYQPILSAADGRCTAMEALVRWQHPTRGLLGPADFIPDAERTGAIVPIGAAVLEEACAFAARLGRSTAGPVAVHVNVSAAQLDDDDFVDAVRVCTSRHGLAPRQLVLEITESMVLDSPAALGTLDALVGLGVAIAVDDFGTGYSALTTLRTLPLDVVKIDKSFVAGLPTDSADHAVVAAIVQMAQRLGLRTVAEGVERPEQQRFLEDAGIDSVQGFLHRRPGTADEVVDWLRHREDGAGRADAAVIPLARRRSS